MAHLCHVVTGLLQPSLDDVDAMRTLPADVAQELKGARIEAFSVMQGLEPCHISSWADLHAKLRHGLWKVEMEMQRVGLPIDRCDLDASLEADVDQCGALREPRLLPRLFATLRALFP